MKKVLLISDGESFPQCAFDFACSLNETEPVLLTGLFLPPMNYIASLTEAGRVVLGMPLAENYVDAPTVSEVISLFENKCNSQGLEYRIHSEITNADAIAGDIRIESRFSDLIVMGNLNLPDTSEGYIQDEEIDTVARHAECPVMILPEQGHSVTRVTIAYDGSSACMHAIKQFIYLFPQYAALETEIVYAHSDELHSLPELPRMEEYASRHLPNLTFTKLDIEPKTYFDTWLTEKPDTMLVAGSGGRSWLSEFLKKSFTDQVLQVRNVPIFTAHRG